MTSLSDAEFSQALDDAKANAGDGFKVLHEAHASLILAYLRSQGAAEPEDLTNETFLSAFRDLHRFSGDQSNFRSWLLTISHRRMTDARRRAGRQVPTTDLDTDISTETASTEHIALEAMADQSSMAMLELLSDDQRAVIALRVMADLSIQEVARILGKRPGAIKALQHRGLETLRKLHELGRIASSSESDYPHDG